MSLDTIRRAFDTRTEPWGRVRQDDTIPHPYAEVRRQQAAEAATELGADDWEPADAWESFKFWASLLGVVAVVGAIGAIAVFVRTWP